MSLESHITRVIWEEASRDWVELSSCDVVVVGAGPSGLTAAKYLAEKGLKTLVLERRLSFGGGIGGGGMLLHKAVVDERGLGILMDFNIRYKPSSIRGLYVVDTAELTAKLAAGALDAGAKIIPGISVEDVIVRYNPFRVQGVVVEWSAVQFSGLHVDPLFIESKAVIDATGHDAEVLRILEKKNPESKVKIPGEKSAYSEKADVDVVEYTGRVIPGLYATGMAVAAVHGLNRMGPIFTGMLLSGRKVAEAVIRDLESAPK
ncbi:sulfide-dependent adenosine diphosphate thiazole synthase [Desulfurococcus amylolyticus]|uniref:Thiamine thiazole synthase n=1 Tax=Desulfurococcus amylolyticus DSM 16532 TaxID=768672 RepID=I3XRW4_DESAM|nr:sulfide-dependent adenosine diphosphate thiazole synthase [Desulfurococcus amylolyticus]AFL66688.1 thiazole-adenylate synthase [Desulfurococcus amylolyticus DSM 16532]